jgi:hypothetical protein
VGNDGRWDNPFWEYHLPVNPPFEFDLEDYTGPLTCEILNWNGPDGLEYRPRLPVGLNGMKES